MPPRCTPQQALSKIEAVHGNRYTLPFIEKEYVNSTSSLTCVCNKHGEWTATMNCLVYAKSGCPKCFKESIAGKLKLTPQQALDRIKALHGDKFEFPYINEEYTSCKSMLTGVCQIHGEFRISFGAITEKAQFGRKKYGCPKCWAVQAVSVRRNINFTNSKYF